MPMTTLLKVNNVSNDDFDYLHHASLSCLEVDEETGQETLCQETRKYSSSSLNEFNSVELRES